jgi:hypothetical protein
VAGVKALLLGGYQLALFGGYGQDRFRLVPAVLEPGRIRAAQQQFDVTLPDGDRPPPSTVIGRGADLHLFTETHWYRLGLDDVVAATW